MRVIALRPYIDISKEKIGLISYFFIFYGYKEGVIKLMENTVERSGAKW